MTTAHFSKAHFLTHNNIGNFSWRRDLYDVCNIGGQPPDTIYTTPTPETLNPGFVKLMEQLDGDEKVARIPKGVYQAFETPPVDHPDAMKAFARVDRAAHGTSCHVEKDAIKAMGLSVTDVVTILPQRTYGDSKIQTPLALVVVARDNWELTTHTPTGNRQVHRHPEGTCNIFIQANGSFEIENQSEKEVIVVVKMQGR